MAKIRWHNGLEARGTGESRGKGADEVSYGSVGLLGSIGEGSRGEQWVVP